MERKAESKLKSKRLENISDIRSLIGSMNQFIRFISNMMSSKCKPDLNGEKHEKAIERKKQKVGEFVQNHHFDVHKETRVKSCASKKNLGAALEQFHLGF